MNLFQLSRETGLKIPCYEEYITEEQLSSTPQIIAIHRSDSSNLSNKKQISQVQEKLDYIKELYRKYGKDIVIYILEVKEGYTIKFSNNTDEDNQLNLTKEEERIVSRIRASLNIYFDFNGDFSVEIMVINPDKEDYVLLSVTLLNQ